MKTNTSFVRNHKRRQKATTNNEIAQVLPPLPENYAWKIEFNPKYWDKTLTIFKLDHRIYVINKTTGRKVGKDWYWENGTDYGTDLRTIKKLAESLLQLNEEKFKKLGFSIPEKTIERNIYGTYDV